MTGNRSKRLIARPRILPGLSAPAASRGFTLLELLLTMVIVGLIISLATLSLGTGRRPYQIDAAAREFVDIAEYALEEAQMSGSDLGVLIRLAETSDGARYSYQWLQRAGDVWRPAPFDEDAFGEKLLPVGVDVVLEIEEEPAELEQPERTDDDEILPPAPQVVFFASGEAIPGIMTWVDIESGEILWEMEWDLLGRFEMRRRGMESAEEDSLGAG